MNCKGLIAELTEYLDGAMEPSIRVRIGTAFNEVPELPGSGEYNAQDN